MFTNFFMELSAIFLKALEKQPFSLLFSTFGLVGLALWNLHTMRDTNQRIVALEQEVKACHVQRELLAVQLAVLQATMETSRPLSDRRRK